MTPLLSQPRLSHNLFIDGGWESTVSRQRPFPSPLLCARHSLVMWQAFRAEIASEVACRMPSGHPRSGDHFRDATKRQELLWMIGVLQDGQSEVLGTWPAPLNSSDWATVLLDVRARGVDDIGVVVGDGSSAAVSAFAAVYPGATVLVAGSAGPLQAQPPRCRRAVAACEAVGRKRRAQAIRAVRRHGSFTTAEEACAFLTGSLARAERMLDSSGGVWPERTRHAESAIRRIVSGTEVKRPMGSDL